MNSYGHSKPNTLFALLDRHGYSLSDLLRAFPGESESRVRQRLVDNALATRRTVWRFGHLGIRPCQSEHFNISDSGFRELGPDMRSAARRGAVVQCYGGSTTLGANVSDGETWPAGMSRALSATNSKRSLAVQNWGAGNLTTLQASLRLLANCMDGRVPDLAIFYGGVNDAFYSWGDVDGVIPFLDRCLELSQHESGQETRLREIVDLIPTRGASDPLREQDERAPLALPEAVARLVRDRAAGISLQEWCADQWQFPVLRFWEPSPFLATRPEQDLVPRIRESNVRMRLTSEAMAWLRAHHWHAVFRTLTADLSQCGQERLDGPLWIDELHASPLLNEHVGRIIARHVERFIGRRWQRRRASRVPHRGEGAVESAPPRRDTESDLYPLW